MKIPKNCSHCGEELKIVQVCTVYAHSGVDILDHETGETLWNGWSDAIWDTSEPDPEAGVGGFVCKNCLAPLPPDVAGHILETIQ